jgi:hypothetical protein
MDKELTEFEALEKSEKQGICMYVLSLVIAIYLSLSFLTGYLE